jgi:hypothetical protein
VIEVVELQHSIYGTRITANLGLDLAWLKPLIRWIPRPAIGPHAHDCIRWIRVGLAPGEGERPAPAGRRDRWWSYEEGDPESLAVAAEALAARVRGPGLGWLRRERSPEAFLLHARRSLERSRTQRAPEGGYHELRLLAAVHAWRGDPEAAAEVARLAAERWEEERARLAHARKIYRRRHPRAPARLPPVPNLQAELERLASPTTGARILRRAGARVAAPGSE